MSSLVAAPTATATLAPIGLELEVKSAEVTLDEAWSPYAQGTIVCQLPTGTDRAAIDPRTSSLRVTLQLRRDFGAQWNIADVTAAYGGAVSALTAALGGMVANVTHRFSAPWAGSIERASDVRTFDLYVREREFDDDAKELTLIVSSDEALMLGDGLAAAAPLDPHSTDLATIAARVLARYGAALSDYTTATVAQSAATIWQPADTAWSYLDNMLEAASLRLWCDESRLWHLTARESSTSGNVVLSSAVLTSSKDSMTLDPQVWADAVVVKYTWTDTVGASQVAWDFAGAQPAKALLPVDRDQTVYPGPGAAAGILSRLQGRGRVLALEADSSLGAAPGQSLTATPPDTVTLAGYLSSVGFRFPDDEMAVKSRGIVDIPVDSWLYGQQYNVTFADVHTHHPTLAANAFIDWSLVL